MMRTKLFFSLTILAICFKQMIFAQSKDIERDNSNYFNEKAASAQAKAKGIATSEINGYVQFLKNDFSSKKALEKQTHKHTPYENAQNINKKEIYLNPNKTSSIGCPNAGFENYDFTGWSGEYGEYSGTETALTYTLLPGVVNTAGVNTSLQNTTNYQTILTVPPTNPNYPNCVGYDSIACPSGGPLVSQIPFISPYSLDGVSCRLLGAFGGAKVSKLKYIMGVTSSNKLFRYSYAVILNNGHPPGNGTSHQPYFKVTIKDQNGNPITACQDFYQDASGALSDTTFRLSHLNGGGPALPLVYRPWHLVSIDLSSPAYSSITSISIEFEVAGCNGGGHIGYAYVDAECSGGGISESFCSGSNAVLTAPSGYVSYQWYDPSGLPIAAPSGTNSVLTVNAPVVGNTYSVSMTTPGGCSVTLNTTISITNVSIVNINSAPSCAGGNSGVATIEPAGSTGVYTYSWTSTSGSNIGQIVSTSQTATNLAPGTYSVLVSSPPCGQQSANLSVGVSPPYFFSQTKTFCGNSTLIAQPGGSNYTWYHNATLIPSPIGTNDTLLINDALDGETYTVVYKNNQGCKDSLAYILRQIAGGDTYFSNIKNTCLNNANGSAILNLITPYAAPYHYFVTGPNSSNIIANGTTSITTLPLPGLAQGTYTAIVNDGECIYYRTIVINNIQTNFTITPTNTVLCFPEASTMNLNINSVSPIACSLDDSLCTGSPTQLFTIGTFTQNGATTYPTPYGNWYTHGRNQYLVRKSELNAAGIYAGKISSLAFKILNVNNSATNYPDFSIKMGCTGLINLPNASSTSKHQFVSDLHTVYSNSNQPISLGWITHNFSQSYVWDGNSNIVIEVCFSFPDPTGAGNFSENVSIQLKQVPYIASMYHVEDAAIVCGGSQLADNGIGSLMTSGKNMLPNMQFGYCNSTIPTSAYTVAVSSNGTITANYANDSIKVAPTFTAPPLPNGSVIYTVFVTNPIGGCIATKTVEVLYPPLTPTVTTAITNTILCAGGSTTLSAFGALNYNWYYLQGTTQTPISTYSMVTVTPPTAGTNTYMVIGNAPCPTSIPDTVKIMVNVTPITNLIVTPLQDVTKCLNKLTVFNADVSSTVPANSGTPYTYSWTTLPGNIPAPGANTDSNYIANSNSTTTLVVTVHGNCANPTSDTVVVKNFVDDLAISIIGSSTTCANTPFTLNSITNGGYPAYSYFWYITPNTNTISNTSNLTYTSPETEGTYTIVVNVNDSCGYQKADFEIITVLPPCNVHIPNIITPNGDNANDFFKIKNIEFHTNTKVTIFDRWGIKVYENSNYNNEWKADGVSDGTFFYVIEVPDDKTYSGFVTVFKDK